jgi:hypothetical protein
MWQGKYQMEVTSRYHLLRLLFYPLLRHFSLASRAVSVSTTTTNTLFLLALIALPDLVAQLARTTGQDTSAHPMLLQAHAMRLLIPDECLVKDIAQM